MAGYATRGNPILGKIYGNDEQGKSKSVFERTNDGKLYTTLGYLNGSGSVTDVQRPDLSAVDTADVGFHQLGLVPLGGETHAGEDVAVYAGGSWAHLFRGTQEQNYIFHVMLYALSLQGRKRGY